MIANAWYNLPICNYMMELTKTRGSCNRVMTHAKLIVDTRNACGAHGLTGEKIVKA
jgi:hypothetical protein